MLVKAYGLHWNPDLVYWGKVGAGNKGALLSVVSKGKSKLHVDFWEAQGIYILTENFRPVYVGKAFGTALGPRVRSHLTDRFAGRWDMFSWFTVTSVTSKGNLQKAGVRKISPDTIIETLEALSILISDPPLNRKRETIPGSVEAIQERGPHAQSIRSYLQQILAAVDRQAEKA